MTVLQDELSAYHDSVASCKAIEGLSPEKQSPATAALHAQLKSLPPFTGGAVGYVSYDCVRFFEPVTARFIEKQEDTLGIPDALFHIYHSFVAFDHMRHTVLLVSLMRIPDEAADETAWEQAHASATGLIDNLHAALQGTIKAELLHPRTADAAGSAVTVPTAENVSSLSNVGQAGYTSFVRDLKTHIVKGDIIQAVPSHRVKVAVPPAVTPLQLYRQLRLVNPSPYMFYVELGGGLTIAGASPEMLAKVDSNGRVETHPIAGTRRRGATAEEDAAAEKDLLADEKEISEHVMLVDLGRNDVGRVAVPGSVSVDSLMHIERYSHVMHIVSVVTGQLSPERSMYDAFRSIFPAGTLSGAPKVRAMQLVADLEPQRRGVYGGAVGWWGYAGQMDTAIAIRTMVIKTHPAVSESETAAAAAVGSLSTEQSIVTAGGPSDVYLQAGGGIVFDSNETDEWLETVNKLAAAVKAVAGTIKRCVPTAAHK